VTDRRTHERATALGPLAWTVVAILLGGVALIASVVPTMRMASADPLNALRVE
jgi:ABC-type lipoprotein release transport system permease subunit